MKHTSLPLSLPIRIQRRQGTIRSGLGLAAVCVLLLVFVAPSMSSAQAGGDTHILRIAAAADLEPLLPEVLSRYEQQTGVRAAATYQSSAALAQQITNGAPFDLFLAADTGFPQHVIDAGLGAEAKPVPYARGTLVLWARKDAPVLHGKPITLDVLRDPALKSVAMANPETAPYGRAAQAAVSSMGLKDALASKLRVASNIAQTAQYADSGNAEIGFLSLTSASTPRLAGDGSYIPVPSTAYPPILQGAVVLKHSAKEAEAERFLHFLATPETRKLLAQKGLLPPD